MASLLCEVFVIERRHPLMKGERVELCHLLLNNSLTPGWWYQDSAQEAPCLTSKGDGERGSQKTVPGRPSSDGQEQPGG